MILLHGDMVRIEGNREDIFLELLNLKITLAQAPELMDIDQKAMEAAVEKLSDNSYKIDEIRRFKMGDQDRTEEFKRTRQKGSQ